MDANEPSTSVEPDIAISESARARARDLIDVRRRNSESQKVASAFYAN